MTIEILIGRTLAYCLHPAAAWRIVSLRGRAAILGAYAAGGYLAVLSLLLAR
jgi:hypothetical protein